MPKQTSISTHRLDFEKAGIKSHAFLAAPKPERRPIINVPRTISRSSAEDTKSGSFEVSPSGNGINESAKR